MSDRTTSHRSSRPAGLPPADPAAATLALWDWRRRLSELYTTVRAEPGPDGWALWRSTRDALFRTHPQSPVAARAAWFTGLPLYDYDPALRFAVVTIAVAGGAAILADAGRDGTVSFTPFALTQGLSGLLGAELTLYWIGGYGGGVFLPFTDATSGHETYGGGRYLLDTIKGADLGQDPDGRAILDFNFAYNPSCAYSDRWTCPLSPPENRLPVPVRAGETTPLR